LQREDFQRPLHTKGVCESPRYAEERGNEGSEKGNGVFVGKEPYPPLTYQGTEGNGDRVRRAKTRRGWCDKAGPATP